jgi:uncharacterized coiled-coil protein SlyX
MNDEHNRIIEMCEKIARLEKTVNNGLSEDIAEIKQDLKSIKSTIDELKQGVAMLKTGQSIQWFLIASILTTLIALFLKR